MEGFVKMCYIKNISRLAGDGIREGANQIAAATPSAIRAVGENVGKYTKDGILGGKEKLAAAGPQVLNFLGNVGTYTKDGILEGKEKIAAAGPQVVESMKNGGLYFLDLGSGTIGVEELNDFRNERLETLKKVGIYTVVGVTGGTAAIFVAPILIGAAGFGTAGVTAGSIAASAQSAFLGGCIVKGSTFALLQSAGATGLLATSTTAGLGTVGGAGAISWTAYVRRSPELPPPTDNEKAAKVTSRL